MKAIIILLLCIVSTCAAPAQEDNDMQEDPGAAAPETGESEGSAEKEADSEKDKHMSLRQDDPVRETFVAARNLLTMGRAKEAEEKYAEVVSRAPEFLPGLSDYAQCLEMLGKMSEAVRQLEAASRVSPNNSGIMFQLAGAYYATGKAADAQKLYERFLWLYPNDEKAGKVRKALTLIKEKSSDGPFGKRITQSAAGGAVDPNSLSTKAANLFNAGKFAQAAPIFEEALRLSPDNKSLQENLCRTYVELGRSDLKVNDHNGYQRHFELAANLYVRAKQYKKAADLYEALFKFATLMKDDKSASRYSAEAHRLKVLAGI